MKRALILEGGAMRGLFTCGVIDVLMEKGVDFNGAAGISAGAVFGCNFKSRQIGRPLRYNLRFCKDPRYCSLRSLIKTGDLYGADFCYRELPDELDVFDRQTFSQNPLAFYIGATDVHTGQCVYHLCADGGAEDMLWMRASASMPLASRPVQVGGYTLLDGGISDAVPFRHMLSLGYERQVIVLTQPKGYRKEQSAALPLFRLALRKYPQLVEALARRHEMYNGEMDEIDRLEASGAALVLRPPEALGVSRTESDPRQLERVYHIGRQEAEKRMPEIRAFLER